MPAPETVTQPASDESAQIACPNCGHGFVTQVKAIIDSADDEGKSALLSGQLNVARCPACGAVARMATPVLYVDREAEVAYVFVPQALQLSRDDQERAIGRLTNRLLDSLPPEERRMYLLQPKSFLTEETFIRAVLESEGVSEDQLRKARDDAALVEALLTAEDEEARASILSDAGRKIDHQFLYVVAALADQAASSGDTGRAAALGKLHDALASQSGAAVSVDDLIEHLEAAQAADKLAEVVAEIRPVLNYEFFTALTQRMEQAGDSEQAGRLRALRSELIAAVDDVDAAAQAEIRAAADTLREILSSADPVKAVADKLPDPPGAFMVVVDANLRAAASEGRDDVVAILVAIRDAAMEVVEANLPPRERLASKLARTPDSEGRTALLDASPELVDEKLWHMLRNMATMAHEAQADSGAKVLEAAAREVEGRLGPDRGDESRKL